MKKDLTNQLGTLDTMANEVSINYDSRNILPSTSIFSTVDGEITDIINIKDSFNRLSQEEKLKIISVLLEFCSIEILREVPPCSKNE